MDRVEFGAFGENVGALQGERVPLGPGMARSKVTLGEFLAKATAHEDWRAPLDPWLQWAVVASGLSIGAMLVGLCAFPVLLWWAGPALASFFGAAWGWILPMFIGADALLLVVNGLSAVAYPVLLIATRGLQAGRAAWHWLAMGEAIVGAVDAFLLAVLLGIGLIALAILAVTAILSAAALVIALLVVAAGASR